MSFLNLFHNQFGLIFLVDVCALETNAYKSNSFHSSPKVSYMFINLEVVPKEEAKCLVLGHFPVQEIYTADTTAFIEVKY